MSHPLSPCHPPSRRHLLLASSTHCYVSCSIFVPSVLKKYSSFPRPSAFSMRVLSVCVRFGRQSDMMLQNDGPVDNKCTCFMYLRPTDIVKELLVLWERSIIDDRAMEDQARADNSCVFLSTVTNTHMHVPISFRWSLCLSFSGLSRLPKFRRLVGLSFF